MATKLNVTAVRPEEKLTSMILKKLIPAALIVSTAASAGAQPATQSLDAIYRELPTSTTQLAQEAFARVAPQGPELISVLAARLKNPKDDEDTTSRFAINGLILYTGKNGTSAQKKALGEALLRAVPSASGDMPKVFLLEQLQYTSDVSLADGIAKYLTTEPLAAQALRTLVATAPKDLARRLVTALPTVDRRTQVGILHEIAKLKPQSGEKEITPFAESADVEIRAAALDALAAIGSPASREVLTKAQSAPEAFYGTQASRRFITYAEQLSARGQKQMGAEILRGLAGAEQNRESAHIIAAALDALIRLEGTAALPDLIKAADSDEGEVRMPALRLAAKLAGKSPKATEALLAKVKSAPAPEVAADALFALGESRNKEAFSAVVESAKSEDMVIRGAALRAAATIDRKAALPTLLQSLQTNDKDLASTVAEQIARLSNEDVGAQLIEALKPASTSGKVVLIEALAARRLVAYKQAVYDLTSAEEATVRTAAYKGLETLAEQQDLPKLLDMMFAAQKSTDRAAARRALVATARNAKEAGPSLFLERYASAEPAQKALLLEAMSALSNPTTLDTVTKDATTSSTPEVQDAAVRALSDWQTSAPLRTLLELAKSSPRRSTKCSPRAVSSGWRTK